MHLPLVLAQAIPAAIGNDSTVTVSVLIALLGGAVSVGALFWRVGRLERDADENKREGVALRADLTKTDREVAVMAGTLGRIEEGVRDIKRSLERAA